MARQVASPSPPLSPLPRSADASPGAASSHAHPLTTHPPGFPPPHPRGRRSVGYRGRLTRLQVRGWLGRLPRHPRPCRRSRGRLTRSAGLLVSVCVRGGARGPLPRFSQPRRVRSNQARPPIEGVRSCGAIKNCGVFPCAGVLTAPSAEALWAVRPRARGRGSCGVRSRPGSPAALGGLPVATRPPRARGRGVPPGARSAPALAGVARQRGRRRPRTLPLGRAAMRRQRPRVPALHALLGSAPDGAEPAAAALTAASLAPRLSPFLAAPSDECGRPVVGRGARPRRSGSAATFPPPSAARLVAVPVCFCRVSCAADAAPLFAV